MIFDVEGEGTRTPPVGFVKPFHLCRGVSFINSLPYSMKMILGAIVLMAKQQPE